MTQYASYIAGCEYGPQDMLQREYDWINPGVLSSLDLVISAGSGLSVNISGAPLANTGGGAWLPGGYRFCNDSVQNVVIAAANTTNPRIDLVVACIDTSQSPYVPTIKAVTGTPAASPVVPSVPSTLAYIPLAQVYVAANATSLTAANITDLRTIASLDGTIQYGITTHSGNNYSVKLPNLTALIDGLPIRVKFDAASTGAITLNVNGLGAKSVVDYFGNPVTNIRANLIANLVYDSANGNFQLQGKGGGGNTIAAHIVAGEIATVDAGPIVGTMPNRTFAANSNSYTNALSWRADGGGDLCVVPQEGYYKDEVNGSNFGPIILNDPEYTANNILNTASIFGLQGSATPCAVLTAGDTYTLFSVPGATGTQYFTPACATGKYCTLRGASGTVRISFDLYGSGASPASYGQIYVNGVAKGTLRSVSSISATTFTEDITVNNGDLIQIYAWEASGTGVSYIKNFIITSNTPPLFNY